MKFVNNGLVSKINETTLEEFIQYSPQILIELTDKLERSDNLYIKDTLNILSYDEIYYRLQYHQKIIINFLHIQQVDILNDYFISSYRVLLSKGVQSEFYLILYSYIKNICSKYLYSVDMINIERIYNYLEANHENFIKYSKEKINIKLDEDIEKLYQYALKADFESGVLLCEPYCKNIDDFNNFFGTKIGSMMNFVGYQWELGEITFAIEHKVTSYIDSILDYFITKLHNTDIDNKKTILITNAPNEEHTLGVKLISNSLMKLGYTVLRVDSDAPLQQMFKVIEKVKPDFVAFSVTLVSNIYELTTIINELQATLEKKDFKIIIGGKAFENIQDPVATTQADLYFENIEQLVEYFKQ